MTRQEKTRHDMTDKTRHDKNRLDASIKAGQDAINKKTRRDQTSQKAIQSVRGFNGERTLSYNYRQHKK